MRIILTRHGETEENKLGISQGHLPGKLSELGISQAKILGEKLKDENVAVIYTSDLARCTETAKEIFRHHPESKLILDKRIRERSHGVFEGKKVGRQDWESLDGDIYTNKPQGGENFEELWVRVQNFFNEIKMKHSDETIVIVGHGGSMCILQGIIENKDLQYSLDEIPKLKNTETVEFNI